MDIKDKIIELRTKNGLSQNQLAKIAGIGQTTLSSIELGKKKPNYETLTKICNALGVSMAEFDEQSLANKEPESFPPPKYNIKFDEGTERYVKYINDANLMDFIKNVIFPQIRKHSVNNLGFASPSIWVIDNWDRLPIASQCKSLAKIFSEIRINEQEIDYSDLESESSDFAQKVKTLSLEKRKELMHIIIESLE